MAITLDQLRSKREEMLHILEAHGATRPRVFGSVARGTADQRSDVDVLIELAEPRPRGFRYVGVITDLEEELGRLLGAPVHVIELHREPGPVGQQILEQAVPL